ncbi:MAG: hypothetical protein Q8P05_05550 [Candidatus Diapherotrites archaeon]|nr:hypothetical protein [Candidatus Diapherotrites archaeon]MDZ4256659.1 hypothetical protein [archaeon]
MAARNHLPLYALFAFLVVGAALIYWGTFSPGAFMDSLFAPSYTHQLTHQGITFASNEAPIDEITTFLSRKESFVLAPHLILQESGDGGEQNSFMAQALIQQQVVLVSHRKVTLTAAKVFQGKEWVGCQTDYGTARQSVFIPVDECQRLLQPNEGIVFEILSPDPSRATPIVILSPNHIAIQPVHDRDIPGLNFLVLRILYPDAPELIALSNAALDQANNPNPTTPPVSPDTNQTQFPDENALTVPPDTNTA